MTERDLELASERDRLYVAIEPRLAEQIETTEEFDRAWTQIAIDDPQMREKFEYAMLMQGLLPADIDENALDEYIAAKIWRYKVANGISTFASPAIGNLLLGLSWLGLGRS